MLGAGLRPRRAPGGAARGRAAGRRARPRPHVARGAAAQPDGDRRAGPAARRPVRARRDARGRCPAWCSARSSRRCGSASQLAAAVAVQVRRHGRPKNAQNNPQPRSCATRASAGRSRAARTWHAAAAARRRRHRARRWAGGYMMARLGRAAWPRASSHSGDAPLAAARPRSTWRRWCSSTAPTLALIVGPVALAAIVGGVGWQRRCRAAGSSRAGAAAAQPRHASARSTASSGSRRRRRASTRSKTLDRRRPSSRWVALAHRLAAASTRRRALGLAWRPTDAARAGWAQLDCAAAGRSRWSLVVLACADYGLQRWRTDASLKMTKQEVKDEAQAAAKATPRSRAASAGSSARWRAGGCCGGQARPPSSSPTRPTSRSRSSTGATTMARAAGASPRAPTTWPQQIRDVAREHGVPIVENVPLAQALYARRRGRRDDSRPTLFGAVAEVLALPDPHQAAGAVGAR